MNKLLYAERQTMKAVIRYTLLAVMTLAIMAIGTLAIDHLNWTGHGWCFHSSLQCYNIK